MFRFKSLTFLLILLLAIPALTFAQQTQEQPAQTQQQDQQSQAQQQQQQPAQPSEQTGQQPSAQTQQPQAMTNQPSAQAQQPQAGGQTPSAGQPVLQAPYVAFSTIANRPVSDAQGNQVGTIKDGFISTSGLITHWIVSLQNMPNVSPGDYVIPVYALQVGLNGITLNLPQEPAGQSLVPAQGAKAAGVVAMDSIRASQLMTFKLVNDQGQNIGSIQDVVANLNTHEVSYAAIDFSGVLGAGQKLFAVPFADLWYNLNRNTVTIYNLNTQALAQNPGIDSQQWPEQANQSWNKLAQ